VGPFIDDQLGYFATLAPPTRITVLEVLAFATQLAILFVSLRIRREIATGG
jgi:hypothetical protein